MTIPDVDYSASIIHSNIWSHSDGILVCRELIIVPLLSSFQTNVIFCKSFLNLRALRWFVLNGLVPYNLPIEYSACCGVRCLSIHNIGHRSHRNLILSVNWRHIRLINLVSAKAKTEVSWWISFQSLIGQYFNILCKGSGFDCGGGNGSKFGWYGGTSG